MKFNVFITTVGGLCVTVALVRSEVGSRCHIPQFGVCMCHLTTATTHLSAAEQALDLILLKLKRQVCLHFLKLG